VQASETVLGPIESVTGAGASAAADPSEQEQKEAEKKSDEKGDSDDSGVDASLGLINSGPVQLKTDLEQPVTSGGMETMNEIPGSQD
jgi:flagellar capping protein FliD